MKKNQYRPQVEGLEKMTLLSTGVHYALAPALLDVAARSGSRINLDIAATPNQVNLRWTAQHRVALSFVQEPVTVTIHGPRGDRAVTRWHTVGVTRGTSYSDPCNPGETCTYRVVTKYRCGQYQVSDPKTIVAPLPPQPAPTPTPTPNPTPTPTPNPEPTPNPIPTIQTEHPLGEGTYQVIAGVLWGQDGPVYTDVQQGDLGDCWLIATFAETAAFAPQDITRMFVDRGQFNENGTMVEVYDVTFFDAAHNPQTVTIDNELRVDAAGNTIYDHPINNVLWPALLEKAYAVAASHGFVTDHFTEVGNFTDSYDGLNFGRADWAMEAITGHDATLIANPNHSDIEHVIDTGQLAVLETQDGITNKLKNDHLVNDHSYAFLRESGDPAFPYQGFNPWNTGDPMGLVSYSDYEVWGNTFNFRNGALPDFPWLYTCEA